MYLSCYSPMRHYTEINYKKTYSTAISLMPAQYADLWDLPLANYNYI